MLETWLPVQEVAILTGLSDRMVRINCTDDRYRWKRAKKTGRRGQPGKLVALSSLPEKAQKKFKARSSKKKKNTENPPAAVAELEKWRRDIAFERHDILEQWKRFAAGRGTSENKCVFEFVESIGGQATRSTLCRWKKAFQTGGVASLAPDWKNPKRKYGKDTISPAAKKYVYDLYLHGGLISMKDCYFHLCNEARNNGWSVPSYSTIKSIINEIPYAVRMKHRYGKKAMEDKVIPHMDRDYTTLRPMQIVESDHHQVDVAVKLPDGKVVFPWLTMWMDVRTRKILSWALVVKPNSDSINISLRELILKYGVPESVHLDNGRDYKSKLFNGTTGGFVYSKKKLRVTHDKKIFGGIYADLNIETHWALPYNAKSKIIERFFKTLRTEFSLHWRGYRGRDITQRPDKLKEQWKDGDLATLEELKEQVHLYVDCKYNETRKHRGDGMENRTPNEVFYALCDKKRAVNEDELMLLCTREPESRTVAKQGIWYFGGWYWSDLIQSNYRSEKVYVRYSYDDMTKLYVFSSDGKYIGLAKRKSKARHNMPQKEFKIQKRYQKAIKTSIKKWETKNLPTKRITDKEREKLPTKGVKEVVEPVLPIEKVQTNYAHIVAAALAEEEAEHLRLQSQDRFTDLFATLPAPEAPKEDPWFFDVFNDDQKEK